MNYLKLLCDLCSFKRNTTKSREQIEALQRKKLRKILKYAYKHSPYYSRRFRENGINDKNIATAPISQFPTIDKAALIKHFDEIVTTSDLKQEELREFDENAALDKRAYKNKYHLVHSSGSTGKPSYFVYDNKAWNYMLIGMLRAALWNMSMGEILKYFLKTPRLLYIAATDGRYGGAMAIGDGIDNVGAKQLFLNVNTPLEEWIEQINEFKPDMILGYPSALKILGELCEQNEIHINAFRTISCGEPLNRTLREYLEKTLKTGVINFYGASESIVMGLEESPNDGMYLFDDMNYIEIVDGEIYLTSLYNFVQPIIRYRLSDKLTPKKQDSSSRYPFTRVQNILGRNEDILWFKRDDGTREFLHPLSVEGICAEGLLDYQFTQTYEYSFEIHSKTNKNEDNEKVKNTVFELMRNILGEKNLSNVRFDINFTDEISPNPKTGKKQLIIKNY